MLMCSSIMNAFSRCQRKLSKAVEVPVGSVLVSAELIVQTVPTITAFSLLALWQETSSSSPFLSLLQSLLTQSEKVWNFDSVL